MERFQRTSFLHRIMTGDEKWVYFDDPKRKKSWNIIISIKGIKFCVFESIEDESKVSDSEKSDAKNVDTIARSEKSPLKKRKFVNTKLAVKRPARGNIREF
ncbi:CNOT6L [Cordylochernes scorpioides]|uniref:CNOT6L n=1 Tax=Cordylochernes scorpioides TaxID=51811 RepID=A0ABY6LVG6_9ARAC|nr:CNOT6L [Cordylochernes scorpioides]